MKIIKELSKLPKSLAVSAFILFASGITSFVNAAPVFVFDPDHDFSTYCERNNVYQSNFSDTDLLLNQCYSGNKAYFEISGMDDFLGFGTTFGSSLTDDNLSTIYSPQDLVFGYLNLGSFSEYQVGAKDFGESKLIFGLKLQDGFEFSGFEDFVSQGQNSLIYDGGASFLSDMPIEQQFVVSAVVDDSPSPSIPTPASFGLLVLAICGMKLRRTKR